MLRGKPRFDAGMNLPERDQPHEFGRELAGDVQPRIHPNTQIRNPETGRSADWRWRWAEARTPPPPVCANAVVGARISSAVQKKGGHCGEMVSYVGC